MVICIMDNCGLWVGEFRPWGCYSNAWSWALRSYWKQAIRDLYFKLQFYQYTCELSDTCELLNNDHILQKRRRQKRVLIVAQFLFTAWFSFEFAREKHLPVKKPRKLEKKKRIFFFISLYFLPLLMYSWSYVNWASNEL